MITFAFFFEVRAAAKICPVEKQSTLLLLQYIHIHNTNIDNRKNIDSCTKFSCLSKNERANLPSRKNNRVVIKYIRIEMERQFVFPNIYLLPRNNVFPLSALLNYYFFSVSFFCTLEAE